MFVILYAKTLYLIIVNDVGITLSAQELPLREAAWPAVGEELEAKSNGLWHRATVAEIGSACWTTETIQFHSFPTKHKSRSVSSFPTQAMCVCVCSDLVCSKSLDSLWYAVCFSVSTYHLDLTFPGEDGMYLVDWFDRATKASFCKQLVDCSRVEQRVMYPHVVHAHASIPFMFSWW